MEDCQLIEKYLKGDNKCFDALYEKYRKPLYSYIYKLVYNNQHLCDDIFQQTWVKIINKLDKYSDKDKFIYWAFTIARNLVIDNVRKNKKHQNTIAREAFDDDGIEITKDYNEPWQDLNNLEISQAITKALDKLPENLREVFLLRSNDVSFKEIAKIQDCSINTVLSRMKYALNKLKIELTYLKIEDNN
ncbi:sigma-70 family RNA polymerase sigma factor [Lentisphaerota bacterium WC36G]|nr:sigma-70 family RNA polymerase sigma factor [Lentisphaerae bacterium WC36]